MLKICYSLHIGYKLKIKKEKNKMIETDSQQITTDEARKVSEINKSVDDTMVRSEKRHWENREAFGQKADDYYEAMQIVRDAEDGPHDRKLSVGALALHNAATGQLQSAASEFKEAHGIRAAREDSLSETRQHYYGNIDAYEQAAIEDANAAGHDVKFGGEHYPAQAPAETKVHQQ